MTYFEADLGIYILRINVKISEGLNLVPNKLYLYIENKKPQ